jgi:RNA polymerase sigma-70 factor, ECF subfamily
MATDSATLHAFADRAAGPSADHVTDAGFLRDMIGGSEEALAALYDRHGNAVYASAMRVSRDASIAAEVVQETFMTLWNRAELFDPSRGTLPTWLQTIARRRTIDHLRSAGRRGRAISLSSVIGAEADQDSMGDWLTVSGELVGVAAPEPGPEHALASKETRASIEEALAALAPLERSVITLAYQTGLSQSEIAARLGWPIGTVKTRTRRALRHLRDWFESPHGATIASSTPAPTASPCQ